MQENSPKFAKQVFCIKFFSILLILCLGILVYSNTFFCSFHFDDRGFITSNIAIRDLQDLSNIWKFYPCRFIVFLSIAFNYHFHQFNLFGYHLFNLIVHLASAVFVWWLVLLTLSTAVMKEDRITKYADLVALFTGLVFVSHPIQIEAVTYIWQRAASMATLFCLASLCFYAKSRLMHSGLKKFYYILSLITTILAMFTKEIAVALPLLILLYEFTFLKDKEGLNWKRLSPFLMTLLLIPLVTFFTRSENVAYIKGSIADSGSLLPWQYVLTQFMVMGTYIKLLFLPLNQSITYDYPILKSIFELPFVFSFLFLMAVLFLAKRMFLKYKLVSFSIFWFLIASLPEAMPFPVKDVIFEHRLYLPMVGGSILLVSSLFYLFEKSNFKIMVVSFLLIIFGYSVLTYQRNKIWLNEFTLWNDVIQEYPHVARAYNGRGIYYASHGDSGQAVADFTQAIKLSPKHAESYYNLGKIYDNEGNFSQALLDDSKAIELRPDSPQSYINRALVYYQLKQYDKAWADVHRAKELGLDVNPQFM